MILLPFWELRYAREVRIIAKRTLQHFWVRHPKAEGPLRAWYAEVSEADWTSPADLKARYATANFVGERVVFNIGGNRYRLVVWVSYEHHTVYVRFVGTHAEYDAIDIESV